MAREVWDEHDGDTVYEVLFGNYANLDHDAWTVSKLQSDATEEDHELPLSWEIMCNG